MALSKVSDSKILGMKERGMSLRQIASALGLIYGGVRKRLKAIEGKGQVSTQGMMGETHSRKGLKEDFWGRVILSTGSLKGRVDKGKHTIKTRYEGDKT